MKVRVEAKRLVFFSRVVEMTELEWAAVAAAYAGGTSDEQVRALLERWLDDTHIADADSFDVDSAEFYRLGGRGVIAESLP